MKIDFKKFSKEAKDIEVRFGSVLFIGTYRKKNSILYEIAGKLNGEVSITCDLCGEDFVEKIEEDLNLSVSDGIYQSESEEFFDVIEQYGGCADMDEILEGELESFKSGYHICPNCNKTKQGV